jgi:hypothetical protein
MVVQSAEQLNYLATTKDLSSLQVLVFDDDLYEALDTIKEQMPLMDMAPLDFVLHNITSTSKDLAWLKLPSDHSLHGLVNDSTLVHLQSLPTLRALECKHRTNLTKINVNWLTELRFLDLSYCKNISKLGVNGLTKLQYMNLDTCTSLTTVLGLDELEALKYLNVTHMNTAAALAGLSTLTELQQLIMNGCSGLNDLPQLGSSENLIHLELQDCEQLTTLSELQNLVSLRHLDLRSCSSLTVLDVTGLLFLQYLNVSNSESLETLTGVDALKALQHLDLSSCVSLCSELNLTALIHLQKLKLSQCDLLAGIQGINTLVSLQHLDLSFCKSLRTELNLTGLLYLQYLDLSCCNVSVDVQGIETLMSLKVLNLNYSQLSTTLDLSKLISLTELYLCDCTALRAVTGISKLVNLVSLNLCHCNSVSFPTSSDAVGTTMTTLQSLIVSSNSTLAYFQRQQLPALEVLKVCESDSITTIDCSDWPSLRKVIFRDCSNLTTLQGLDKPTSLELLWLTHCQQLKCLPKLTCLETLKVLSISGCTKLSTIFNKLTDFEALNYLEVDNSGIGLAIVVNTDNNLVGQVSALQQRSGFQYIDYAGVSNKFVDADSKVHCAGNVNVFVLTPSGIS